MKASELRPGQFFECDEVRAHLPERPKRRLLWTATRLGAIDEDGCSYPQAEHSCTVELFAGWDDEPKGDGYRILSPDEPLQAGDEIWLLGAGWEPSYYASNGMQPAAEERKKDKYRRKVESAIEEMRTSALKDLDEAKTLVSQLQDNRALVKGRWYRTRFGVMECKSSDPLKAFDDPRIESMGDVFEEVPPADTKLESILSQMNGKPDSYRECIGNPRAVLARICANAKAKAKRKKVPEWSVIGEWTGHGSGVSAAIYEYYSQDSDTELVNPAPSTPEPQTVAEVAAAGGLPIGWVKPEPQPFKAGDLVVCVEVVDGLTEGKLYRLTEAALPKVKIEDDHEWSWYFARRFRHATAAEIAAFRAEQEQLPMPLAYTLQLQDGKRRDGQVVGPCEKSISKLYPWSVGDGGYTNDGYYSESRILSPRDLIREVPPPVSEPVQSVKATHEVWCNARTDKPVNSAGCTCNWMQNAISFVPAKRDAYAEVMYGPAIKVEPEYVATSEPTTEQYIVDGHKRLISDDQNDCLAQDLDELRVDLRTASDQVEALSKDLADHKQLIVIKNRQLDTMTADNQRLRELLRRWLDDTAIETNDDLTLWIDTQDAIGKRGHP